MLLGGMYLPRWPQWLSSWVQKRKVYERKNYKNLRCKGLAIRKSPVGNFHTLHRSESSWSSWSRAHGRPLFGFWRSRPKLKWPKWRTIGSSSKKWFSNGRTGSRNKNCCWTRRREKLFVWMLQRVRRHLCENLLIKFLFCKIPYYRSESMLQSIQNHSNHA